MSKVYQVCSGTTYLQDTVFFTVQSNCDLAYTTPSLEQYDRTWQIRSSGYTSGMPSDFTYNYWDTWVVKKNGTTIENGVDLLDILVPANTYEYEFPLSCKTIWIDDDDNYTILYHTYTEAFQQTVPNCYTSPSCHLTLTLSASTPTIRGGSDGAILCTVNSGGTSQYWQNGVSIGTFSSPHTITGLTSGEYVIRIQNGSCFAQETIYIGDGEFRTGNMIAGGIGASGNTTQIYATENPIILNLSTAISSINPKKSINKIYVTGATISGVSVNFTLTFPQIYNAQFLSKGYPDRNTYFLESTLKNQIGQIQGSNTLDDITTSLTECLQQDSLISRLYYISNTGTTITLESREYGDMYDLPTVVSISGNGITIANTQSGVIEFDGQSVADYSLYCELYVDPNLEFGGTPVLSNYKRVTELELPFNNTNQHRFDLGSTLKNFVYTPKIDFNMTGFTSMPTMDTTFYCVYGEKYPLIENTNTKKKRVKGSTEVKYALNSAVDFELENSMDRYLGVVYTGATNSYTSLRFMNTCSNPKYISRGSKEYLYYLLKANYPNALTLGGTIHYYNGSSTTGVTFLTITNFTGVTNFGGVTCLAAGYDELGLAAYEASGNTKIRKVDFAVYQTPPTGATVQLTEIRSYLFEIDEQPNRFNVAFLNKIGTIETFSFVGEVVDDATIERQSFQTPYGVADDGSAAMGFVYNGTYDTSFTNVHTVNTGTIDIYTYYYVMELLQSNKIWNYSAPYENSLTVVGQAVQKSSNQAEYTVQVTFKETIFVNNVEK